MISFILALVFMLLALITVALHKTYNFIPIKELKRRARTGDPLAKMLYRAAGYGASLGLLLWGIVVIALVISFVLLEQITPPLLALIVEAVVIGVGYTWIPTSQLTRIGVRLVVWTTPAVVWLLRNLNPLLGKVTAFVRARRPVTIHTGLYEREDLLALLERQRSQPDSRITHAELDMLIHTLTFGEKMVREAMVPRREVRSISADDSISPLIMQELHATGYSRFPVYQDKEDHFAGTLYLRDFINLKATGHVRDLMEHAVYYVHEEYPLEQVLHAFLKTKHHLFIVVNRFEEYVGIITIEDIIEQILGCKIVDEFDRYDDLRAVAADHARHDHRQRKKDGEEPVAAPTTDAQENSSDDATEVVE